MYDRVDGIVLHWSYQSLFNGSAYELDKVGDGEWASSGSHLPPFYGLEG